MRDSRTKHEGNGTYHVDIGVLPVNLMLRPRIELKVLANGQGLCLLWQSANEKRSLILASLQIENSSKAKDFHDWINDKNHETRLDYVSDITEPSLIEV